MDITNRIVEIAAWGVSLANYTKNYGDYQDKLIELITPDNIMSIKPFEKNYKGATPAGVVVETKDYILVSYRGTELSNFWEVLHDSQLHRRNMRFGKNKYLIHSGFITEYEESKESLKKALAQTSFNNKPIIFSGHSLGGALSNIAALDFTTNKTMGDVQIGGVITFGAPRVFSHRAANLYNNLGLGDKTVRVIQKGDPIPEAAPFSMYKHTGKRIEMMENKARLHSHRAYRNITGKLGQHHIDRAPNHDGFEVYLSKILTMARDKILLFTGTISREEYKMRDRIMRERELKELIGHVKK